MKVAIVNEKLNMANMMESMRNQIHDLHVENLELQASLTPAQQAPLRSPNSAESVIFENNNIIMDFHNLRNEVYALRDRVDNLECRRMPYLN